MKLKRSKKTNNIVKLKQKKLWDYFRNRKKSGKAGIPILSVTMNSGLVERDTLDRKMASDLPPESNLLVEPGDIVYNMMRMWQGAVAVCTQKGLVSPAYVVCTPNDNIDPFFALYLFKSQRMLYKLTSYSYGITGDRLRLYFKDFAAIPVDLPPLPEQKKIAEILSTWDRAIEQTRKLIEAKKNRRKGMMQQLLSGRKSPISMTSSNDWNKIRARDLFKVKSKKNSGHLPVLSVTQNDSVIVRKTLKRKIESAKTDANSYKLVEPGDFIISLRSFQGGLELSEIHGVVSPAYHVIHPIKEISKQFYKYYFKSYDFIGHLAVAVIGIRDGKQVSYDDFSFLKLPYPTIKEQQAIAQVLQTADKEINQLETNLQALEKQKRGLMQKLLTGEIRVTT